MRERWWFIAVANCNSTSGLHLKYRILMTNGDPDNKWFYHFSADEFYILQMDIAYLVLFTSLVILTVIFGVVLRSRQLLHTTYKMYVVSICLETVALLFAVIANGRYMQDGVGLSGSRLFSEVLDTVSTLVFQLLLILLAKGFTVTRGRLRQASAIKISVFMTLYTVVYAAVFVTAEVLFDPGLVLYRYESLAGYILIAMRLLGWLWFSYATFFTLKHYPEKWPFYLVFFLIYTAWFVATPIMIVVANTKIDKWVRAKVVNGIERTVALVGYAFFLVLTNPASINKVFPFHVRTSQIGVMDLSQNGDTNANNLDNFVHHMYAPSETPDFIGHPRTNFTELFTVASGRHGIVSSASAAVPAVESERPTHRLPPLVNDQANKKPQMNGVSSRSLNPLSDALRQMR